jgi:hypothetical protein
VTPVRVDRLYHEIADLAGPGPLTDQQEARWNRILPYWDALMSRIKKDVNWCRQGLAMTPHPGALPIGHRDHRRRRRFSTGWAAESASPIRRRRGHQPRLGVAFSGR